jgi:hypothetical protein
MAFRQAGPSLLAFKTLAAAGGPAADHDRKFK